MTERWIIGPPQSLIGTPTPWTTRDFAAVTAEELTAAAPATADFRRYSPSDGYIDMVHVPTLPREAPVCSTRLAVCHDAEFLYIILQAAAAEAPIPELADAKLEDFSVVIPLPGAAGGLYFGLNQLGEAIGLVQLWDPSAPCPDAEAWPWSLLAAGGVLTDEYQARCLSYTGGLMACFQLRRSVLVGYGAELPLSVSRRCYATGELVSWGGPVVWTSRPDQHGTVTLVPCAPAPPPGPQLQRLDLLYDPLTGDATLQADWAGVDEPALAAWRRGPYADYADKLTVIVNDHEQTVDLAPSTRVPIELASGWSRIALLTTGSPPRVFQLQAFSGQQIVVRRASCPWPAAATLDDAFAAWHQVHETHYQGGGVWGAGQARPCLCHAGIFHLEPYLYADLPAAEARVHEACERMLAAQHADGWFPCFCAAQMMDKEPELGDGGAFTNGSVGEGLALAAARCNQPSWLEASVRAADYGWYRWEHNQNYAAFVLWHLAALQTIAPQPQWLPRATWYARHWVMRDIGPGGAQDGHNYFTAYGNITLKGMAQLLAVLPADDALRPLLRDRVVRYTNQLLSRQQADGRFAGRNRKYLGYCHLVPGLFFVARALPELAPDLAPALAAMTAAAIAAKAGDPDTGLVLALAARSGLLS